MASIKTNTTSNKRKGKQYIEATIAGRKVHRYALSGKEDVVFQKADDVRKIAERKAKIQAGARAQLADPKVAPKPLVAKATKPGYLINTVKGSPNYGKQYKTVVENGMTIHRYAGNVPDVKMGKKKR